MSAPRTAWCSGCYCEQLVDRHWRALWVDSDGDLKISRPLKDGDLDYERPDTVLVCGDGSALKVMERYLSDGSILSTPYLLNGHPQPDTYADLT